VKLGLKREINSSSMRGGDFAIDSLQKVMQYCIRIDVVENGTFSSYGADFSGTSSSSSSNSSKHPQPSHYHNKSSSYSSPKGTCPNHPNGKHSYDECFRNPKNHKNNIPSSQGDKVSAPHALKPTTASNIVNSTSSSNFSAPKPVKKFCTNCNKEGHYPSECKQPLRERERYPLRSQQKPSVSSVHVDTVNNNADSMMKTPYSSDSNVQQINKSATTILDRTLPEAIVTPRRKNVFFKLQDGHVLPILLDTGANASCIDASFVKEAGLSVTINAQSVELADVRLKSECSGYVSLELEALFPSSDKKPIKLKHDFFVLPIRSPTKDYDFIVGTDLVYRLFPGGIPEEFTIAPFRHSRPVQLSVIDMDGQSLISGANLKSDNEPTSVIPIDNNTNSIDVEELEQDIRDMGAGDVPVVEEPTRASLATPDDLKEEHDIERANLLFRLKYALEQNAAITGFCVVNEAMVVLEIDPAKKHTLYRRQYPIAERLAHLVSAVIQRWLETGKIMKAPPGCRFNNPLVVAPKKDENGKLTGIRVCLDTRLLNLALIVGDRFQIPEIRNALDVFAGCSIFGEFDLAEAYLQFPLHPDSRQYTAFSWDNQQYMFVGCPYGISFIPSHFQRVMSMIMADLPFTFPYIDNLPFGSKTWEEHEEHAYLIIDRLNKANLRIKPSSVNLGHAQIKCLGHILSAHGTAMDPDKIQTIRDWPLPNTGTELMSFLGLGTYLQRHVRHYAELTARLQSIKFQKHIEWTPELEADFEAVKFAVSNAPFLQFPDYNRAFYIACDASQTGIGGVLYQPLKADEYITPHNIVSIYSHKLTETEQRYPTYKKELFGVVACLRHFHAYVWGRNDLVIITDHKPLLYILNSLKLSPALQQWLDVILDYNFTIQHRPGVLHVLPDQLSRMYVSHYEKATHWGVTPFDGSNLHDVVGQPPEDIITSSFPNVNAFSFMRGGNACYQSALMNATSCDNDSSIIEMRSLHADANSSADLSLFDSDSDSDDDSSDTRESSNNHVSNDNSTSDSLAQKDLNLLVELERRGKKMPKSDTERKELISKAHLFGHFGREAIFKKLWNQGHWWPRIRDDITHELKSCDACIRFTVVKMGFDPPKAITANGPGDHIQIDLSTHLPPSPDGHQTLLVIIDVFTGFVILRSLKDHEAETVARKLWKVFCLMGFPKILQSDNGGEFVNDVLRAIVKISGIDHRLISAYNPRADGKVERAVGSTTMIIKKLLHGVNENWPIFVPFAQVAFNQKISSLTNSSPFSLMFGRTLNDLTNYNSVDVNNTLSLQEWHEHQEKIISLIYPALSTRIRGVKDKMLKRLYHTRRQLLPNAIPTGSTVMLVDPKRDNKFEPKYLGPYTIVRRAQNGGYVLKDATGDILHRHVPPDQLKLVDRSGNYLADNIYTVNKIVDHRGNPGNYEFLVDWKGYKEQTWEPESNILDYDVVKQYWNRINQH